MIGSARDHLFTGESDRMLNERLIRELDAFAEPPESMESRWDDYAPAPHAAGVARQSAATSSLPGGATAPTRGFAPSRRPTEGKGTP